jgi:phosphatidylinositol glycan class O
MASTPRKGPRGTPASKNDQINARAADQSKESAIQEQKARELENEFKTKHFGVMGVLTWIL